MMVPDDAGPVPYQRVMRPLRGERTISVAKCPKQDLNLRWRTFKVRVSSAGLFGRVKLRALSGASIRFVQHFKMGGPISLFPWYETMVPDHHCSFVD